MANGIEERYEIQDKNGHTRTIERPCSTARQQRNWIRWFCAVATILLGAILTGLIFSTRGSNLAVRAATRTREELKDIVAAHVSQPYHHGAATRTWADDEHTAMRNHFDAKIAVIQRDIGEIKTDVAVQSVAIDRIAVAVEKIDRRLP